MTVGASHVRSFVRTAVVSRWNIVRLLPTGGARLLVGLLLINVGLAVLPVGFMVATSALIGRVAAASGQGPASAEWHSLVPVFVIAAGLFLANQALAPLQVALNELLARRVDGQVFDRLLAASLRSTSVAPLEDQRLLDALHTATRDLELQFRSPGSACAGLLALVARYGQLTGCAIIVGLTFAWSAAIAVVAVTIAFRFGQRGGLRRYSQVWREVADRQRESDYFRYLGMQPPAGKEIRVFGLLAWVTANYVRAQRAVLAPVWAQRRRIYLRPFLYYTTFAAVSTTTVIALVGGRSVDSPEAMVTLTLCVQAILAAVHLGVFFPECDTQTQFGMDGFYSVLEYERGVTRFIAENQGIDKPKDAAAVVASRPAIEITFRDVRFSYPNEERPVFDGLQLSLPAGKCTAVVGLNGAGKTTLVKLLARLYDQDSGVILSDGVDIRSLDVDSWRKQIGVIFQDFVRYELSAAENITMGAAEYSDDRAAVRQAAEDAGILSVLDGLPMGLQTPLSRRYVGGTDLSGGQWQRVAIARAMFARRHGASILVLDEPTAALDVRAEAEFFQRFADISAGATTLLISHRFSSVRHADHIVVIEAGQVTEKGTHDELLAADRVYARLFRLQSERFLRGEGDFDPEESLS